MAGLRPAYASVGRVQPAEQDKEERQMAELTGNEILAKCLKAQGVKDIFFIMGGPMLDAELCSIKEGIRLIDTRHEQGAAYMAQAYSRAPPGRAVCMPTRAPATLELR